MKIKSVFLSQILKENNLIYLSLLVLFDIFALCKFKIFINYLKNHQHLGYTYMGNFPSSSGINPTLDEIIKTQMPLPPAILVGILH